MVSIIAIITNNWFKHNSFVYTQLKDQTVLFLIIQFGMSFVWIRLNVKQFYSTYR